MPTFAITSFWRKEFPTSRRHLQKRNVGFVLRRFPEHSLVRFCDEVKAALVVGDENPMREPESWRIKAAKRLSVPLWTVDADVIVPSKLLEKAQYAAYIARPRLQAHLPRFLVASKNPLAQISWKKPKTLVGLASDFDITQDWKLDRSVSPVLSGRVEAGKLCGCSMRSLKTDWRATMPGATSRRSSTPAGSRPIFTSANLVRRRWRWRCEKSGAPKKDKETFLDQLITWRELSMNLVRFNADYDNFECGEPWAHRTLASHAKDRVRFSTPPRSWRTQRPTTRSGMRRSCR